jgi:hypothetical protein
MKFNPAFKSEAKSEQAKPKDCREIIEKYLRDNGYAGLCAEECGCGLDDFMPCSGEWQLDCKPAYAVKCPKDKCENYEGCILGNEDGEQICYQEGKK